MRGLDSLRSHCLAAVRRVTWRTDTVDPRSYDLKQEISKSPVSRLPPDLARHPAAQSKMSSAMKRRAEQLDE